jgi:O-antigen ligase
MSRFPESNGGSLPAIDRAAELVATFGVAAYVLCLPLEFTGVLLRQQLSRYVLVVVALAFAYLLLARRRTITLPRSPSFWVLVAYVGVSLASWVVTRPPGSLSSVADIALYPFVALLVANLVLDEAGHRRAWVALLVSCLAVAVLGAALYVTHLAIWTPNPLVSARMNITFGDPNITARFLALGACAAVLLFSARKAPSWLAVATAIACAAVLPLTLSRSGLILFVVAVAVAVVVAFQHRRAATIGAVALLVFAISIGVNPDTRQRAEDTAATAVSAVTGRPFTFGATAQGTVSHVQVASEDNRRYLVAAGLRMFQDHPVTGVGFGGYQRALLTTYRGFLPSNLSGANLDSVSHSSFVTVMAEQGAIGTLLFVAFLLLLAMEAWRARRAGEGWSLWIVLPATLVIPIFLFSQFEGRFFTEPYLWLMLGLTYSAQRRPQLASRSESSRTDPARRRSSWVEGA